MREQTKEFIHSNTFLWRWKWGGEESRKPSLLKEYKCIREDQELDVDDEKKTGAEYDEREEIE